MDHGGTHAHAMMRGNPALIRNLRTAVKREVKSRPGMRWRGWGHPFFQRTAMPALRVVLAVGVAAMFAFDGEMDDFVLRLFVGWTWVSIVLTASGFQWQLRDPAFLALPYTLPMDDPAIHRHLVSGFLRDVRANAWDWLCFFGVVWLLSGSWTVMSGFAVVAGALVMAAVVLGFAVCLVLLLPPRINLAGMSTTLFLAVVIVFASYRVIPQPWLDALLIALESTPIWILADWTMAAIRGDGVQAGWLAISAVAMVPAFFLLWRVSAARFDVAKQVGVLADDDLLPADMPEAVPTAIRDDAIRANLHERLARRPGAMVGELGLIEKSIVNLSSLATRRRLDLLQPAGITWGIGWWAGVAGIGSALLVGLVLGDHAGVYLFALIFYAIPVAGGTWALMRDQAAGLDAMHPWACLPIRATDLGRTMLWVNHLRLVFALPLVVVALGLLFPGKPLIELSMRVLILLLAAMPVGVFFQFAGVITILGPRGRSSVIRIITVLGGSLAGIFFGLAIMFADPAYAVLAAVVLLAGVYGMLAACLRRIDGGKYDFL